jgi:hypothetical protein
MNSNVTAETLALMKGALGVPVFQDGLTKNITISTGLTQYDLQAPAKNLYPIITPLRNSVPRVKRAQPGDAARWRSILAITGSGYDAMGWVPEGQRTGSMSYAAVPFTAPYFTLGEEDTLTFEAEAAAVGFEDVNATLTMRLLQKMMRKEESGILGGNASVALGVPTAPTLSASGSGATLPSATYSSYVVALTREGWANSPLAAGVATTKVITGNDGNTYTLNGGSSNKSANTTQAVTLGQTLFASTPAIQGAYAYAWYFGTVGNEVLQAITTINSVAISAPLLTGMQTAASITADNSRNQALAFDGFLSIAAWSPNAPYYNSAFQAPYYLAQPTGTAGTGTPLTSSGRGSVIEIDNMFLQMWNNSRLSPSVLYVHGQEMKNITSKVLSNASGPLLRYDVNADANYQSLKAGGGLRWYYNPFDVTGGTDIPIKVHPDLPPGTLMAYAEALPAWYQNNETENPICMQIRRDYYRTDWPLRTRRREYGVYAEEVLTPYAPFAIGVITNIGNG